LGPEGRGFESLRPDQQSSLSAQHSGFKSLTSSNLRADAQHGGRIPQSPPLGHTGGPKLNPASASDRLIVALDTDRIDQARALVDILDATVSFFKIGLGLALDPGTNGFLRELTAHRKRVFLDYKFLDIEATVERAVAQAARLGVDFLTIHHAGPGILQAAVKGRGASPLKLLAVTVLTSLDEADLRELGYDCTVSELVLKRAKQAHDWGCDGVIASGREAELIRSHIAPKSGNDFLIVTPGIRPAHSLNIDQKRAVTPAAAIAAGSDYLVVGRPIVAAPDPAQAARAILDEMQSAFAERNSLAPTR
jgi:orotidine-5'-phosphate decarboxylase